MAGPAPVELSTDCTSCGLEAGVVELYDALVPACRFGLPATARCKLCGLAHEGTFDRPAARPMREVPANRCPACLAELGPRALDDRRCATCGATASLTMSVPPAPLDSEMALTAALEAWAAREQFRSVHDLATAVFCDPDLTTLLALIKRGEPLEVVADPFANMGIRTTSGRDKPKPDARPFADAPRHAPFAPLASPSPPAQAPADAHAHADADADADAHEHAHAHEHAAAAAAIPPPRTPAAPPDTPPPASAAPRSAPPRAIVYPLVSVISADGEVHPAERALVDRFLGSEGLAPLSDDEFRVHHPSSVAHLVPKERREMVVQLMCETATVDGMPDESERRVIRAYAAAWDVPDEKVEFWMWGYENMSTSLVRQLWMKLRRFVLSARWSDAGQERR